MVEMGPVVPHLAVKAATIQAVVTGTHHCALPCMLDGVRCGNAGQGSYRQKGLKQ